MSKKYEEMSNLNKKLTEILCEFVTIPMLINEIRRNENEDLKDKSDSYKLGYINAAVEAKCGEIEILIDEFGNEFDEDEFYISDYVHKGLF